MCSKRLRSRSSISVICSCLRYLHPFLLYKYIQGWGVGITLLGVQFQGILPKRNLNKKTRFQSHVLFRINFFAKIGRPVTFLLYNYVYEFQFFLNDMDIRQCPLKSDPWQRNTPSTIIYFQTDAIEKGANAVGISIPSSATTEIVALSHKALFLLWGGYNAAKSLISRKITGYTTKFKI